MLDRNSKTTNWCVLGAMDSWGRSFVTCPRCQDSWIFLDRIGKRPTCSYCGLQWSQKNLTREQKRWVQFQQWNNDANYGWPPQNRYGGWNQAVREGSEPAADALEQVWDNQGCANPSRRCRLGAEAFPAAGASKSQRWKG